MKGSTIINEEQKDSFPKDTEKHFGLMELVVGESIQITKKPDDTVFTYPNLLIKIVICSFFTLSLLMLLSLFFDAPLEGMANPSKPSNPPSIPWYFLGLQELVSYSALIGGVILPLTSFIVLIFLPYIDRNPNGVGFWFSKKRIFGIVLFSLFILANVLLIIIGGFFRGPNWMFLWK